MAEHLSTHLCPLCGQPNRCAMAQTIKSATDCWCRTTAFHATARAYIQADVTHRACLCQHCATTTPPTSESIAAS